MAKEREAAAAAGQEGFIKDQEAFLKRVKEEWAALRSALRRRLGAARTLLLTDGACRLHAVPSDRLEQVKLKHEKGCRCLFLGYACFCQRCCAIGIPGSLRSKARRGSSGGRRARRDPPVILLASLASAHKGATSFSLMLGLSIERTT